MIPYRTHKSSAGQYYYVLYSRFNARSRVSSPSVLATRLILRPVRAVFIIAQSTSFGSLAACPAARSYLLYLTDSIWSHLKIPHARVRSAYGILDTGTVPVLVGAWKLPRNKDHSDSLECKSLASCCSWLLMAQLWFFALP